MKLVGSLGVNLDIVTTAEGVETFEELKLVQEQGFRQIQGYLIGRPEPPAEFLKYFDSQIIDLVPPSDQPTLALPFPVIEIPNVHDSQSNVD